MKNMQENDEILIDNVSALEAKLEEIREAQ